MSAASIVYRPDDRARPTRGLAEANLDLGYPQTQGVRQDDFKEQLAYFASVDALAIEDVEVHRQLIEEGNLRRPLSALNEQH
jgi:hypothetical protein